MNMMTFDATEGNSGISIIENKDTSTWRKFDKREEFGAHTSTDFSRVCQIIENLHFLIPCNRLKMAADME